MMRSFVAPLVSFWNGLRGNSRNGEVKERILEPSLRKEKELLGVQDVSWIIDSKQRQKKHERSKDALSPGGDSAPVIEGQQQKKSTDTRQLNQREPPMLQSDQEKIPSTTPRSQTQGRKRSGVDNIDTSTLSNALPPKSGRDWSLERMTRYFEDAVSFSTKFLRRPKKKRELKATGLERISPPPCELPVSEPCTMSSNSVDIKPVTVPKSLDAYRRFQSRPKDVICIGHCRRDTIKLRPLSTFVNPHEVEYDLNPVIFPSMPSSTIDPQTSSASGQQVQSGDEPLMLSAPRQDVHHIGQNTTHASDLFTKQDVPQFNDREIDSQLDRLRPSHEGSRTQEQISTTSSNESPDTTSDTLRNFEEIKERDVTPEPILAVRCSLCDLMFTTEGQRRVHHNRRHNRRFTCPDCHKAFNLRADLERHSKTVHRDTVDEKRSVSTSLVCPNDGCDTAEKRWTRKDNFKRHVARCLKKFQR